MNGQPFPYAYLPVVRTWWRIDRAHDLHDHGAASNDNGDDTPAAFAGGAA